MLPDIRRIALPLSEPADLAPLVRRIGNARHVLLGEATHGTAEFYTWRAELSKILIEEHGFSFVAVEGDWPDCYRVNRFVKGFARAGTSAEEVLHAFARWPTWMWANREVEDFISWLHHFNALREPESRVGFYGLDVYSLYDSMEAVVRYLDQVDPALARDARRAYNCFEPFQEDAQDYARATYLVPTSCEEEAIAVLRALRESPGAAAGDGRDAWFDAEQNALIARNAERYYRTMIRGGPDSWNVRDRHMMETLERLMAHHGPAARAIVWEHNTHIGDARFTDMKRAGMLNLGQLAREARGDSDVVLVGFGTHRGTVIAAEEWGLPMQRMVVPAARHGSLEHRLLEAECGDALLIFDGTRGGGIRDLEKPIAHRAIGVVYDPDQERWGNYVPSVVPRRYDAFCFIEETRAVDPLHLPMVPAEAPETYPSGM